MAEKRQGSGGILKSLRRLVGKHVMVKIWRENLDPHAICGFVVDLSSDFVVVHLRNDDMLLDGHAILRIQDITLVEDKLKFADFYLEALRLRGFSPMRPVGICLTSTASILESVNKHYPLVTVFREEIRNDECSIGRIEKLTDKTVILKWLTPGAKWDGYSSRYRLIRITRVDCGGLYQDALARVAGIESDYVLPWSIEHRSAP